MKYELQIRSRPKPDERVVDKHERISRKLAEASELWLPEVGEIPPAKDPRTEPALHLSLTRKLSRVVKGSIAYANRKYLLDEGRFDDWLSLEFDSQRVDFDALVTKAFPKYLAAFGAYRGYVCNEEFSSLPRPANYNSRRDIGRVFPVSYFDSELCSRSLGVAPETAAMRVGEIARTFEGGLLVLTPELLPFEKARNLSDALTECLLNSRLPE